MAAARGARPVVPFVIGLHAGAGEERLDAAEAAAVARGPGPLVVSRPRQRIVAPLPCNPVRPGQDLAAHDDAGARARADNDPEDHGGACAAPSAASETAKQFASFAIRTSDRAGVRDPPAAAGQSDRPNWRSSPGRSRARRSRECRRQRIAWEPARCSSARPARDGLDGRLVITAWRLDTQTRDLVAAAHRDALDLRAAEIDPDAHMLTHGSRPTTVGGSRRNDESCSSCDVVVSQL